MVSLKCGLCLEAKIDLPSDVQAVFLEGSVVSFLMRSTIEMWHLNDKNAWEHLQTFSLGPYTGDRGLNGHQVYHKGECRLF